MPLLGLALLFLMPPDCRGTQEWRAAGDRLVVCSYDTPPKRHGDGWIGSVWKHPVPLVRHDVNLRAAEPWHASFVFRLQHAPMFDGALGEELEYVTHEVELARDLPHRSAR